MEDLKKGKEKKREKKWSLLIFGECSGMVYIIKGLLREMTLGRKEDAFLKQIHLYNIGIGTDHWIV